MDGAYLIWDELLVALTCSIPAFLQALVDALFQRLIVPTATDAASDVDKEALAMWLVHVTSYERYLSTTGNQSDRVEAVAMKWCCLHAGHWSQHVGSHVLETCNESVRDAWQDLFEASLISTEARPKGLAGGDAQVAGADAAVDIKIADEDSIEPVSGWLRAPASTSVPIGVVR